jgi:structure-specific endonuclease subunit SLX1
MSASVEGASPEENREAPDASLEIRADPEEHLAEGSTSSTRDVVYLLCSEERPLRTYVGYSNNPQRRLRQHNGLLSGGARYTRVGRPWRHALIVSGFRNRSEALRFEFMWKALGRLPRNRRRRGLGGRADALLDLVSRPRWTRVSPPSSEIPLTLIVQDERVNDLLSNCILPEQISVERSQATNLPMSDRAPPFG